MTQMRSRGRSPENPYPALASLTWLVALFLFVLAAPMATAWADDGTATEEAEEVEEETAEEEEEEIEAHLPWVYDIDKAMAQAKAENKDLLIKLTGSDWCPPCKALEKNVFSNVDFVKGVEGKYVCLYLDFPRSEEAKAKVVDMAANEAMRDAVGLSGYPTVVLALPDGTPYAKMSGYGGTPAEAYLENLTKVTGQRDVVSKALACTAEAAPSDKDAFAAGFKHIADQGLLSHAKFAKWLPMAEALDTDGELGLKDLAAAERSRLAAAAEMEEFGKLLPRGRRPSDEEWEKIVPAVKALEHVKGPQYLNFVFGSADWLIRKERGAEAKAMLEAALGREPMLKEGRAKMIYDQFMGRIADLEAPEEVEETEEDTEEVEDDTDGADGDK